MKKIIFLLILLISKELFAPTTWTTEHCVTETANCYQICQASQDAVLVSNPDGDFLDIAGLAKKEKNGEKIFVAPEKVASCKEERKALSDDKKPQEKTFTKETQFKCVCKHIV